MNRVQSLYGIKYPIIQGGMIWCSGWELAAAVSNAGGLGLIGAGSMYPEVLDEHIQKCKKATHMPFGVNLPLLYPHTEGHIALLAKHGIKHVFTSAGSPAKYTHRLKELGMTVTHVVSNIKFAIKAQNSGVDAIVAEGFEAGGHNGFEETTTLVLLQQLKDLVTIPIIGAGGIASGSAMAAVFALGASGIQLGSLFAACHESSAHDNFKQAVFNSGEGETRLQLKKLVPVRLLKNAFSQAVADAEDEGRDSTYLAEMLGKGRARSGMFLGDIENGELEIGQVSSLINTPQSAAQIIDRIVIEYKNTLLRMNTNMLM